MEIFNRFKNNIEKESVSNDEITENITENIFLNLVCLQMTQMNISNI